MQNFDGNLREGTESNDEVSVADIITIFWKRIFLILGFLAVGFVAGFLLSRGARTYQADGSIRIQPGMSSMYRTSPLAIATGDSMDKIASEATILQSRTLYMKVAQELNLVNEPAFWGSKNTGKLSLNDPVTRERLIRTMRARIKVAHGPKDEIVNISCSTTSPALSAKIVNTLINDYIEYLFQMRYGATQRASTWLIGQLGDLKNQIQSDQTTLTELQDKLGVIGFGDKNSSNLLAESLDAMTKASSEATVQRIVAEAKYRFLSESDPTLVTGEAQLLTSGPGSSSIGGLLQTLRGSQATASSNYARLLAQFGPNYPDVREAKAQLDAIGKQVDKEQERILNQSKVAYNAASANEKMTSAELAKQKAEAFRSRDDMVKYSILLHEYESHRTLYEGLVQRLREAGITSGMESGEIDIIDLADLPAIPNPPGPLTLILAGGLAGLVLALILAVVLEMADTKISGPQQAEKLARLPLLAILPHFVQAKSTGTEILPIEILADSGTHYAEAMQSLRTSVMLATPGSPPQVILVTSALPADGKSTVSRNLAAVLSQHKARVLLIDCDLRRGTVGARILGDSSVLGLSTYLTQHIPLAQITSPVQGSDLLSLIPSGPRPPEPAVLIGSMELRDLVLQCRKEYDFIILDSPPVLGISDALNLGRLADAVVFVVRSGTTQKKALVQSRASLSTAKLTPIGFVLNDVDLRAGAYGYGYGSSYMDYYRDKDGTA